MELKARSSDGMRNTLTGRKDLAFPEGGAVSGGGKPIKRLGGEPGRLLGDSSSVSSQLCPRLHYFILFCSILGSRME